MIRSDEMDLTSYLQTEGRRMAADQNRLLAVKKWVGQQQNLPPCSLSEALYRMQKQEQQERQEREACRAIEIEERANFSDKSVQISL